MTIIIIARFFRRAGSLLLFSLIFVWKLAVAASQYDQEIDVSQLHIPKSTASIIVNNNDVESPSIK
jgi:hypothetical protein